jgi:ABC-type multidrug transport system ATPase subunit
MLVLDCSLVVVEYPFYIWYMQGLWVNFTKDQLFCLLGPNGAGKTTTMNCLTGITPVTGGDGNILSFHGSYTSELV